MKSRPLIDELTPRIGSGSAVQPKKTQLSSYEYFKIKNSEAKLLVRFIKKMTDLYSAMYVATRTSVYEWKISHTIEDILDQIDII